MLIYIAFITTIILLKHSAEHSAMYDALKRDLQKIEDRLRKQEANKWDY